MHGGSPLEIIPRFADDDDPHLRDWSYDFPHTCEFQSRRNLVCDLPRLCAHHHCGTHCFNNCRKFVCAVCTRPAKPVVHGTAEQLLLHAKMYEIADKYDVIGLKELVQEKFKRGCEAFWSDDAFAVAAHHAFATTPADEGLRDVVKGTISNHMELIRKPEIQVLMNERTGLALGVLLQKAEENGWVKM